jgi:hypothetical protein
MNACELLAEIVFCIKETTHNEEKPSAFLSYCCAILLKICSAAQNLICSEGAFPEPFHSLVELQNQVLYPIEQLS